jgi:hypothetical protein
MAGSILRDEAVAPHRELDPLSATLDRRRRAIADAALDGIGLTPAQRHPPNFVTEIIADVARCEPEAVPGFQPSPFELLGRELMPLVEDYAFATEKRLRTQAKQALDRFLEDFGGKLSPSRPSEGPPTALLNALAAEAAELVELCWDALQAEPSDETRTFLTDLGAADSDVQPWAARLAAPVLSRAEVQALQSEAETKANWRKGQGPHPTPLRFVIWVLAHRLDVQPTTLARSVHYTGAEKYFRRRTNPIDTFRRNR